MYNVKYTTSYKRPKSGGITTIDILEKDYSGDVTPLNASDDPLYIYKSGNIDNIYEPTLGSGADINLKVQPGTMWNLFTTDPQKYIVKVYHGESGSNLKWQGFVNTGIFSEDYSQPHITPITITCNDGIELLNDISYKVSETGTTYYGFPTIAEVLTNILDKLNLSFDYIYTSSDLLVENVSSNIFQNLTVNNENYIDEKGMVMSCREVIDTILQPLGLVMKFKGSNIYIIDPINLHNPEKGKRYSITGTNEITSPIGGYIDLSGGTIPYHGTGQPHDITKPYNQVSIKYDPYTFVGDSYDFNSDDNYNLSDSSYSETTNNGITYKYYYDVDMADWQVFGIDKFYGIEQTAPDEGSKEFFIRQNIGSSGTYQYTMPLSQIKQDDNMMLQISMEVLVNTRHITNIISPSEGSTPINELYLDNFIVSIGVTQGTADYKYYDSSTGQWSTSLSYCKSLVRELDAEITTHKISTWNGWFGKKIRYVTIDKSNISDKWMTITMYIPLSEASASSVTNLKGSVRVTINRQLSAQGVVPAGAAAAIKNVLIRNVAVSIVDTKKMDIDNSGIETLQNIDSELTRSKKPISIDLKQGCGKWGASRSAFSSTLTTPSGTNITKLYRTDGSNGDAAELLGQNLLSQYGKSRHKFQMNLNVKNYHTDLDNYLIKDSNYLGDKAFYIVNGTYNDRKESYDFEMVELAPYRENL